MANVHFSLGYKITLEETGEYIGFLIMLHGHWVVIFDESSYTAMVYDRHDDLDEVREDLKEIYGKAVKIHDRGEE